MRSVISDQCGKYEKFERKTEAQQYIEQSRERQAEYIWDKNRI
jgi:hypothetical protein